MGLMAVLPRGRVALATRQVTTVQLHGILAPVTPQAIAARPRGIKALVMRRVTMEARPHGIMAQATPLARTGAQLRGTTDQALTMAPMVLRALGVTGDAQ
jgi:hypothetical protein